MEEDTSKPKRLMYKTYLQLLQNSVGSAMFRNFYVATPERGAFDALNDGGNSCAFYVSGVLVIFGKIKAPHGTVSRTVEDMRESGWRETPRIQAGDVVVWQAMDFADGSYEHIGFALNDSRAVSTSGTKKKVIEHDMHFGKVQRPIKYSFRYTEWDNS